MGLLNTLQDVGGNSAGFDALIAEQGPDSIDFLQFGQFLEDILGDFLTDFLTFQYKLSRSFKQFVHMSFSKIPLGQFLGDF